jgi:predicted dehydrogenase
MKPRQANTQVSRRDFVKGASAVAVSAPYFLTSSALGAEGRPPASERITMGFIGVGGMGGANLGSFLGFGEVQVLAVCDVDPKSREEKQRGVEERYADAKAGGTYRGCDAYNDFRELAARDDLDAVCVATPDHWHALAAVEALRNGKDVYCEKPLSLTIHEARAMANAVRRYGRVFQTGSQQRSESNFRFACEMVQSGRIGKVETVHVSVGGPSGDCYLPPEPVPDGLDWDRWLGPAPYRPFNSGLHPFNWRGYRDYSGGGMTDWGAHHFDIAQWGLGMDHSGPVEVTPPDGKEVKMLTYKYANGVTLYHGGGANGVLFTGTDGKVEVNRGYLQTWPAELQEQPTGSGEVHLYDSRNHRGNFLECIRTRRKPVCDVEIGCRSVTVCHLGNLAYWLNRPLKWDPVKEEFLGDAEANRWLERAYRGEWRLEA